MTCELRWLASVTTNALHAAAVTALGFRWANSDSQSKLAGPIQEFLDSLILLSDNRPAFWRHALPLSAGIHGNKETIRVTLKKAVGGTEPNQVLQDTLVARLGDLERELLQLHNQNVLGELEMRVGPIRQQWESLGIGILKNVVNSTDESLMIHAADVSLLLPILGGGGWPHLSYNSVRIEGVLTNTHEGLPEVLRLVWLLSQLSNDLPMHSETIHASRIEFVSKLAMLPAVLKAGESFGIGQLSEQSIREAIAAWHICQENTDPIAATVLDWWHTFTTSKPNWNIALRALDKMTDAFLPKP